MDPWTGGTQWGDFNPATGAFSNYGDSGDSGTLGRATYVSPTQGAPGGDERTLWLPFDGAVPIPVPEGLSWVKLSFCNPQGLATELFAIVERRAPVAPVVDIELMDSGQTIRLSWAPVPGALAYRIYRAADGYFGPDMEPWLETEHAFALDATEPAGTRWCYKVTTVYAQ
jgi:hypothetical protein